MPNDPDANSTLYFSLADENDTEQVLPFVLDANGSSTLAEFLITRQMT